MNYEIIATLLTLVVKQNFEAEADNEYVILGNSAIMKCEIPSFVADFVQVEMWMDSIGNNYYPGVDALGLQLLIANFSELSPHPIYFSS